MSNTEERKTASEDCTNKVAMPDTEKGKVGYILLWALGVPIPILVAAYFLRGCN
jgi:hypothetical protein